MGHTEQHTGCRSTEGVERLLLRLSAKGAPKKKAEFSSITGALDDLVTGRAVGQKILHSELDWLYFTNQWLRFGHCGVTM